MPASDAGDFIVAAPDSPTLRTPYQAGVYQASEDHAEAAIQNAINDLPSAGGTVRILSGNYTLKRTSSSSEECISIVNSNVRLLFEPGATLKLADDLYTAAETFHIIKISGASQGEAKNVSIWGPGIIDGNLANQNRESGIGTEKHKGLQIVGFDEHISVGGGLTLQNIDGQAMDASGNNGISAKFIIDNLRIVDCGEGALVQRMFDASISNLHIQTMDKQDGLEILAGNKTVITNCTIRDTNDDCLDLFTNGAAWGDIVITGCTFGPRKSGGAGTDKEIISINNGSSDSLLENIVISGCFIDMGNAEEGIVIGPNEGLGTGTVKFCLIVGNVIDGTGSTASANGIVVDGTSLNIFIASNLIHDCPGNAIDLSDNPDKVHVKHNSGWGNNAGILAGTGSDNILSGNDFIA